MKKLILSIFTFILAGPTFALATGPTFKHVSGTGTAELGHSHCASVAEVPEDAWAKAFDQALISAIRKCHQSGSEGKQCAAIPRLTPSRDYTIPFEESGGHPPHSYKQSGFRTSLGDFALTTHTSGYQSVEVTILIGCICGEGDLSQYLTRQEVILQEYTAHR